MGLHPVLDTDQDGTFCEGPLFLPQTLEPYRQSLWSSVVVHRVFFPLRDYPSYVDSGPRLYVDRVFAFFVTPALNGYLP